MSLVISTRLESLSNEVLLEIFEYLDAYTLCSVFYRMNWRLRNLIRLCRLHIRFDKHKRDKEVWDALATFMNPVKIYALSLYSVAIHKRFLPSISENLVLLYFYRMNRYSIDRTLQHLPTINQIKTLCSYLKENCRYARRNLCWDFVLSTHGHRLTSLVNCSLKGYYSANEFSTITAVFSKLRRLSLLNFQWTSNLIQFLRENTPNLRSLYFHRSAYFKNELIPSVIKHIRELDMNVRGDLKDLKEILSTLPCLKRLRILYDNTRWSAIADGTQWQEIIEKYLPCLQHFILDFAIEIDEEIAKTFCTGEFWSTKKVVMKLVINKVQSRYRQVKTIYFGQQWHFKYFNWTEVKNRHDHRNLNLPLQSPSNSPTWSQTRSSSPPSINQWSASRSRSPPTPNQWSESPSYFRSRSRSPLSLHSRSRSRSRRRLQQQSRSRSRPSPSQRHRSRSPLGSPSASRSRLQSTLRLWQRSRSRSRRRSQRRLRSRSRLRLWSRSSSESPSASRSRLKSRLRLWRRSRSRSRRRSQRRSRSRPRLRLQSRSSSESPSASRSRLQSRLRLWRRSRSRSRRGSQRRSRSRPRLRLRSRSSSESPSASRSRLQSRLHLWRRSRSRSRSRRGSQRRSRSRPRMRLRSRSRSGPRLRSRPRSRSRPRLWSRSRLQRRAEGRSTLQSRKHLRS